MDIGKNEDILQGDMITHVVISDAWTHWRDELAQEMFNTWRGDNIEIHAILVECLVEHGVAWKEDNGFKPGFHKHLEKVMAEKMSGQNDCGGKRIYKEWVKTQSNAKRLYKKPFPYFDVLGPIFGKDRANGENAEVPLLFWKK
ncbi:hypothetical protein L6164_002066 [Bauhinia variegata]|uniref:Uncharacterized protein n=1 Tax=Bauhinia variegata TaxID=167791 RepID=A0ACB9PWX2_BAUVA|nr:hypothetical protein L6164_002066 [Bauhinia variegata]